MTSPITGDNVRKGTFWLFAALVCVLVCVLLSAGCALQPALPSWATCEQTSLMCDGYEVRIADWWAHITPPHSAGAPYDSPAEWRVQNAVATDVNNDGTTELVFLAWRQANYGTSTPFWEENDTTTWTQHVFIMQPGRHELVPVWMTSQLGVEVVSLATNGRRIELTERDGTRTQWEWVSWGLTLIEE